MKWIFLLLTALLLSLQYQLWFSHGIFHVFNLSKEVSKLENINAVSKKENQRIEKEILNLKAELPMVEKRARYELGMVKPDETFYQFVNNTPKHVQ